MVGNAAGFCDGWFYMDSDGSLAKRWQINDCAGVCFCNSP